MFRCIPHQWDCLHMEERTSVLCWSATRILKFVAVWSHWTDSIKWEAQVQYRWGEGSSLVCVCCWNQNAFSSLCNKTQKLFKTSCIKVELQKYNFWSNNYSPSAADSFFYWKDGLWLYNICCLFTKRFAVYTCRWICHYDSSFSPSKENGFLLDSDLHSLHNDSHPGTSVFLD